jgi:hypothetical protein
MFGGESQQLHAIVQPPARVTFRRQAGQLIIKCGCHRRRDTSSRGRGRGR